MPAIQQPKQVSSPTFASGSVLGTAVPVTSLVEQYLKICLYGRNRVGKTTLSCQFPKPLLLVSFEPEENGGAMSVSKMDGISIVRIRHQKLVGADGQPEKYQGSAKAVMLARELSESNPFKTVVLDTVTSLQEIVFTELLGLSKVPEMLSWGIAGDGVYQQRAEKTRETIRPYIDLKCNVVFCAQEKDHNPVVGDRGKSKILQTMQQQSFFSADLGGTNARWLQDACGYVVQLYEDELTTVQKIPIKDPTGKVVSVQEQVVGTGKRGRHLRCLYHPNFAGGFRSPSPEVVPEFFSALSPKEMYEKMMRLVRGERI